VAEPARHAASFACRAEQAVDQTAGLGWRAELLARQRRRQGALCENQVGAELSGTTLSNSVKKCL
jgi:hypothetical protein